MRRSVSIGVALVAGAMAWSDATGAAAPGPNSQQAAPNDSVPSVDVELVIAVDVSYSMDLDELAPFSARATRGPSSRKSSFGR